MTEEDAHRAFITSGTALESPTACPEIRLHLATAITPLWQASESYLHGNNLAPPYWAFAWAGGQGLARYLLDSPWLVRGRRVLDFGAGCGIAGIAAAMAGALSVDAADVDPMAAAAAALNAESNNVIINVLAGDITEEPAAGWEVVLAGDVCYERPMTERCMPWLQARAAEGALVLLSDPGRAYLPEKGLVRLTSYTVPTSREIEDRDTREVVIYRVAE
jgi:predicted nicotinamide N-methyase